jgi:hypothetical protein
MPYKKTIPFQIIQLALTRRIPQKRKLFKGVQAFEDLNEGMAPISD